MSPMKEEKYDGELHKLFHDTMCLCCLGNFLRYIDANRKSGFETNREKANRLTHYIPDIDLQSILLVYDHNFYGYYHLRVENLPIINWCTSVRYITNNISVFNWSVQGFYDPSLSMIQRSECVNQRVSGISLPLSVAMRLYMGSLSVLTGRSDFG